MSAIDPDLMDITLDPPKSKHQDDSNDAEDDPITASYQVFLNPSLPLGRRLLVLQHPNRTDNTPRPPPTELRLKEHSGMVEVDIPQDNTTAYDREKGLKWGRTLQNSMAVKNGGSHGLAGGFGVGAVQQRAPRKKGDVDEDDNLDWNDAVRQGKVLSTQTLGGQYPDTDEVQYMVGVFQGKDLHLTPVSNLIHLRPQLHHIDATTQQDRQSSAAAAASSKEGGTAPAAAARAIHMTIKTAADGTADGVSTETMADRLRSVQTEPWRKMRYTDENEETAWEVYNDSLFLRPKADPTAAAGEPVPAPEDHDLEELVPTLGNKWNDKEFLESISGITKPEPVPVQPVEKRPEPRTVTAPVEEAPPPKTTAARPRAGAAAALASRRGGRSRAAGA
ncbi:Sin-like protein conserved region domain-containing protein [Trichoderma sp. SZMC 28014]